MRFTYLLGAAALLAVGTVTTLGCSPRDDAPTVPLVAFPDAGPVPEGSACASHDDCGPSSWCAFDITEGCAARGVCKHESATGVCAPAELVTVCACAGYEASFCGSSGLFPFPVAHLGGCDGGVSSVDASADASADR